MVAVSVLSATRRCRLTRRGVALPVSVGRYLGVWFALLVASGCGPSSGDVGAALVGRSGVERPAGGAADLVAHERWVAERQPSVREGSVGYADEVDLDPSETIPLVFDPEDAENSARAANDHIVRVLLAGGTLGASEASALAEYALVYPQDGVRTLAVYMIGRVFYDAQVDREGQRILKDALRACLADPDRSYARRAISAVELGGLHVDESLVDSIRALRASSDEALRGRATLFLEDLERNRDASSDGPG